MNRAARCGLRAIFVRPRPDSDPQPLNVDLGLAAEPVTYLSGTGPLAIGAAVTPEGLLLSRAGPTAESLLPFVQEGQSDVVYHSVGDAAWQGLFP